MVSSRADTARTHLVEAIAWWKVGLPNATSILAHSAADALAEGIDSSALAELAGIPRDEDWYSIERLIERLSHQIDLSTDLAADLSVIAVRRMCRKVLSGEILPRDLSQWVHSVFHHQSDSGLLNTLAELDDDYDDAVDAGTTTIPTEARIRAVGGQLINAV